MKKINVAKLLKDCPQNMELDCAIWENVTLKNVVIGDTFPIKVAYPINNGDTCTTELTKYGGWSNVEAAKCVIFPKGKTTWEGFVPPCKFKEGDVLSNDISISIYNGYEDEYYYGCYVALGSVDLPNYFVDKENNNYVTKDNIRYATEEEKQKLFDAIKANGYKWNPETKILEKLIAPKFKEGDVIQDIDTYKVKITEVNIEDECYGYESMIAKGIGSITFSEQDNWKLAPNKLVKPRFKVGDRIRHKNDKTIIKTINYIYHYNDSYGLCDNHLLFFKEQDNYELVPNKFDINTLKPFDKVLIRLTNNCVWMPKLFSHYDTDPKVKYYPFVTIDNIGYPQCIPYNGNEHLCRKTYDCDEFYKTWK